MPTGTRALSSARAAAGRGAIAAESVLVAANIPVNNWAFTIPSLPAYRSYAIAAPFHVELHGLFWDTDDPYHYTRAQEINAAFALLEDSGGGTSMGLVLDAGYGTEGTRS